MKLLLTLILTLIGHSLYAKNCFMQIYFDDGKHLLLRNEKAHYDSITTDFILPTPSGGVKFGEIVDSVLGKVNELESAAILPEGLPKSQVNATPSRVEVLLRGFNYERGMSRNELKFLMSGTLIIDPNDKEVGWLNGRTASIICKKN